jgi:thymidylate synthase
MWAVEAADAGALYAAALRGLAEHGQRVAPRGEETREFGPAALTLRTPARRLAAIHDRQLNPFLMLAEVLWILAGRDDVAFLARVSSEITRYAPPGSETFPDAYGPRLRRAAVADSAPVDQLAVVVETLRRDRDTRRALMGFWAPSLDANLSAHAVPCNIAVDFKCRDDGLRMTVFNRSNDVHIGLLFNLVQFGVIAEVIAQRVGVPLVSQTHITTSLHLYTASPIERRIGASRASRMDGEVEVVDLYAHVAPLAIGDLRDDAVANACRRLDADESPNVGMDLGWCGESPWLRSAVLLTDAQRALFAGFALDDFDTAIALLARAPRSDWWVLAAEAFARRLARQSGPGAARARAALDELASQLPTALSDFIAVSDRSAVAATDGPA